MMACKLMRPLFKEETMKAKYSICCPWCGCGEVFADRRADVKVSLMCSICKQVYLADFQCMRGIKHREIKEWVLEYCKLIYRCPCKDCSGEIRSNKRVDVNVSVKCPKKHPRGVSRYYMANLETGETYLSVPVRKDNWW